MKYASAAAFRTALEARLKTHHDPVGITRLRKRIVFERLLARLQVVAPDAWVLKGGFALELRLGELARTTKDIDVDWSVGEDEAVELLLEAAELHLDDCFEFSLERTVVSGDPAGGGERWAVLATLAGREFERVAIDVGFARAPVLEPETVVSSRLLEFAGVASVRVPALAIEQHVAEKLHAYTRTYAGDKPSSRVKDLVDLVVIPSTTPVHASRLGHAISEIFGQRATHAIPEAIPPPPNEWEAPWRNLVSDLPADDNLLSGHAAASAFLDPVLCGTVTSGTWDPGTGGWS